MQKIDFKKMLDTVLIKKVYIIVTILFFIVLGCLYTFGIVKEKYEASTTLILGNSNTEYNSTEANTSQLISAEPKIDSHTISTYSELIKSNTSIKEIKNNLSLNISDIELKDAISVSRVRGTDIIKISVKHTNSKVATDIANEVAKVFSKKIKQIYKVSEFYVVDPATQDNNAYNTHHALNIVIFTIFGIVITFLYTVIICIFDTTVKSPETIEKDVGLKILASIPNKREKKKNLEKLIDFESKKSNVLEVLKTLRTNVQFTNIHNKTNKVILVTSCFSGEGKSYVAANLASIFAKAGKKVILIDMDMRIGRQADIFGVPNQLGISNYLSNIDTNGMEITERINSYIKETSIKNLNIITSGTIPPNPSDLLTSEKLPELIKDLSVFYDIIIIDGAPALPVADSLLLTAIAGSTILVSSENKTKIEELKRAKKDLQNMGGRIIGVVLNQISVDEKKAQKIYAKSDIKVQKETEELEKTDKKDKTRSIEIKKAKIKNKINKMRSWILRHINFYKKREAQLLLDQRKEIVENLSINTTQVENIPTEKEVKKQEIMQEKMKKQEEKLKHKIEQNKKREEKAKEKEQIKNEKKEQAILEKEIADNEAEDNKIEIKNSELEKIEENEKNEEKFKNEKLEQIKEKSKDLLKRASEKTKIFYENTQKKISSSIDVIKEKKIKKRIDDEEKQLKKDIENEEKQKQKEEELKQKEIIKIAEQEEKAKKEAFLAEIKEKEKLEKERKAQEKRYQKEFDKRERKTSRILRKKRRQEEAKIKEDLLDDNLYPKTKYNKNL